MFKVDKNAPQYAAYLAECRTMIAEINERENAIRERQKAEGQSGGLDNEEVFLLRREEYARLKEIQRRYWEEVQE